MNNKENINKQAKNIIEISNKLFELELNFRKYIMEKELSEESYKIAAAEYIVEIKNIDSSIENINNILESIDEEESYLEERDLNSINMLLGKIWRVIIMNKTFCKEYGGVQLTEEITPNIYNDIYEGHLIKLEEFMYRFINTINLLSQK